MELWFNKTDKTDTELEGGGEPEPENRRECMAIMEAHLSGVGTRDRQRLSTGPTQRQVEAKLAGLQRIRNRWYKWFNDHSIDSRIYAVKFDKIRRGEPGWITQLQRKTEDTKTWFKSNSNMTSFFRFVNKRASYPFGIISLAHAPQSPIQSCRSLQALYLCKRLKSSPKTRDHVTNDHVTN